MAIVANPHKQFNYRVSIEGLLPVYAQKVRTPDKDIEIVMHGEGNKDIKTGGKIKIGKLTIEKIIPATGVRDLWADAWLRIVQDSRLGGGAPPQVYKRTVIVELLDVDGVTPIKIMNFYGCWPSKVNGLELDAMGSDNTAENIELEVDDYDFI